MPDSNPDKAEIIILLLVYTFSNKLGSFQGVMIVAKEIR